jgi:Mlo family
LVSRKTKIDDSDKEEGRLAQKNLFWFGSPSLVVSLIQFMNFGYAIALATVIMYWPYLTLVEPYWYLLAVFGCYFIFLYNLSVLLPQFTLVTSLGYLTNYKQLQETVAHHRLEEAQRQQRRRMIERAIEHDSVIVLATHDDATEPVTSGSSSGVTTPKTVASVMRSDAGGIIPLDDPKEKLLAELIKSDTTSLRNQLPEQSRSSLINREARRSMRKKAVSDGVAVMRAMSSAANGVLVESRSKTDPTTSPMTSRKHRLEARRHNRRKSLSQPELIQVWQNITVAENEKKKVVHSVDDADAEHHRHKSNSESNVIKAWQDSQSLSSSDSSSSIFRPGSMEGPNFIKKEKEDDAIPKWKKERAARLAGRRQAREKAQSASAVIQSWRDFSVTDPEPTASRGMLPDILSEGSSEKDHDLSRFDYACALAANECPESQEHEAVDDADPAHASTILSGDVVDLSDAVIIDDENEFPAPPSKASKPGTQTDEADDETVNTDKSIGNLSDVDVFETTRGVTTRNLVEGVDPFQQRCLRFLSPTNLVPVAKNYFSGGYYPTVSHVFGTLVVFFIVGHRVEAFIALSGFIIKVDSFGWATNLLSMFWSEVVFLMCFVIADLMILCLFPLWKSMDPRAKTISIAAASDLILTGTVMVLIFVAEAQRCCTDESQENIGRHLADRIGQDYEFEEECTCGRWGSRTYTGLGIIEPFTSIIALRIFRFVFASFLVSRMGKDSGKEAEDSSDYTDKDHSSDPHSHDHGKNKNDDYDHGHGHGGGSVLELWERAITQHPDIVQKYGQFSGELLQAMLGLQVDVQASEEVSTLSQAASANQELTEQKQKAEHNDNPETWQSHIKLSGTQYAKLSPDAQGLIIAGRLGKPVKSMLVPMDRNLSGGFLPTVDEGTAELTHASSSGLVEFEVDKEQMLIEHTSEFAFVAPFARLVRSMRRCDRRHLPLLTKWVSVDVVMTQFEIVYFEAKDGIGESEDDGPITSQKALLSALQATKGGKGLRLCDVATGRKVVGHLDLADITEVHVEQDEDAISDVSLLEKAAERYHSKDDLAVEFWHDDKYCPLETDPKRFARAIRWTIMKEERLKLTTLSGTLVLRFFSDLECAEIEKLGNTTELHTLNQDIALQWAETIARIVGQDQLHQALPHFGENNDEELRDYLEVVHFHNKEAEKARKKADRDLNFLYGDGEDPSSDHEKEPSARLKKSVLSRPKSFGEHNGGSERGIPRPISLRSFRRSVSMGAARKARDDDDDSKIEAPSIV